MIKKTLFIFLLGLMTLSAKADIKAIQGQLRKVSGLNVSNDAETLLTEGHNNMSYHANWPEAHGGDQALLIIEWDGLPIEDLGGVTFITNRGRINQVEHHTQGKPETYIYVYTDTPYIRLNHDKYGTTNIMLNNLSDHDVWSIPVVLDKLVNIEINPLTDYNKPVRVTLVVPETGAEIETMSPANFPNMVPGNYNVRFAIDGRNEERNITVTPTQKVFGGANFDFRHFKDITLESTEKGYFYIDGAYYGEGTVITANLPYGTHTVAIKVNENLQDEKTIDVNKDSEDIYYLSPIPSITFEVVGMYQGKKVPTTISVPGLSVDRYNEGIESDTHRFTLPVDSRPYTYYLDYNGHKGSKEIKVNLGMSNVQEVKLKADSRIVWPWEREYENVNNWWEFSYVAKQYRTSGRLYDDNNIKTTVKENGVWDDGYDKWLHGFRLGYHYQPAFKFGLGLYTGFFSEFYFSGADQEPIDVYDKYFEWDLSVPIHILYQFPLAKKFSVGFHTGPSFNYAVMGSYYDKLLPSDDDYDNVEDWTDFWHESWAPSRFNVVWDFSVFVRWKKLMISGTLSSGLTNNKMHENFGSDAKTVMNKAVVAISFGL